METTHTTTATRNAKDLARKFRNEAARGYRLARRWEQRGDSVYAADLRKGARRDAKVARAWEAVAKFEKDRRA